MVYGQNIQVAKSSEELKIIAEIETHTTERVMNFIYAEAVIDNNKAANTYLQIFREQKWWDAPVLLHAELRTFIADGFLADNIVCATLDNTCSRNKGKLCFFTKLGKT